VWLPAPNDASLPMLRLHSGQISCGASAIILVLVKTASLLILPQKAKKEKDKWNKTVLIGVKKDKNPAIKMAGLNVLREFVFIRV
jgi:hypothetical protein